MELIERYLHAVRFLLPKEQQDDIVAELREDLQSRIEDKESSLGRGLSESEVSAMLGELGPPIVVAGRYLPQRHLIGPVFFPAYFFVLKLVLGILPAVFLFLVIPLAVLSSGGGTSAIGHLIGTLFTAMFSATGVITIVFALLERYPVAALGKWNPQSLPRVPAGAQRDAQQTPWFVSMIEVLIGLACTLVFLSLRGRSEFTFGNLHVILLPIWQLTFWPIFLVLLSGVVKGLLSMVQPANIRLRAAIRLAAGLVTLAVAVALLIAVKWIDLSVPGLAADQIEKAVTWTNLSVGLTLLIIVVVAAVNAFFDARSLWGKNTKLEMRTSRS